MRNLGLLLPSSRIAFEYYLRAVNRAVRRNSKRHRTAAVMTVTLSQADWLLEEEMWWTLIEQLKDHARRFTCIGIEAVMLGSLAWYRFADEVAGDVPLPLLHPLDGLESEMRRRGDVETRTVGVLAPWLVTYPGTLLTRLERRKRRVLVPAGNDDRILDDVIKNINEGSIPRSEARCIVVRLIRELRRTGAEIIVIGSAELASMLEPTDWARDCYNLPEIESNEAARWMLADRPELLL